MKLIRHSNKKFFAVLSVAILLSGFFLYVVLNFYLSDEINEKLYADKFRIVNQLKFDTCFASIPTLFEAQVVESSQIGPDDIHDVMLFDPVEKEEEPFRELISFEQINRKWYKIIVRHSIIEDEDFVMAILMSMFVVFIIIVVFLSFLNDRLSKQMWSPFYYNLNQLKSFSLSQKKSLELKNSKIEEFQDLKKGLEQITNKLLIDYKSLKEFTENASHEIQTPLSIISINLEEVLQEDLSSFAYQKVYHSYLSAQRLSKINQKLLLLAKIDNQQYEDVESINVNQLLAERLNEFEPLLKECELECDYKESGNLRFRMDPFLASLLFSNLLSNLITHSKKSSKFTIVVTDESISIRNQVEKMIDTTHIFDRFHKESNKINSSGLGLSIVKKIVEVSNLSVSAESGGNFFQIYIKKNANH